MRTPSDIPFLLRGGLLPGVTAGLIFGTIAFFVTGELSRGLAFLVGAAIAFAFVPRILNAFRAFCHKPN